MISVEVYWHAVKHRSHTLTSVVYVVLHISLFTAKRATGVSKKEGTNKTYVCHILLQRRITPKWNLLKLYPGKSSGSQAWESQPCDGGKAHQGWRDDKLHHLHVDPPPSPTHQRWAKSLTHKRRREKFFSEAARRWGGGEDADGARTHAAVERGHCGRDKVRRRRRRALVYRLSPRTHACSVYTRGVRSCQTGMAQAWSEPWLIARVQVEFTGGPWHHRQNEWQTQNRVMEYYQEAICNPGRAWISKGCCLSEMKSSITSTSHLIRSWVAFKRKARYCARVVCSPKLELVVCNILYSKSCLLPFYY